MATLLKTEGISVTEQFALVLALLVDDAKEMQAGQLARELSLPKTSIYVVLQRMEQKKLIKSRLLNKMINRNSTFRLWSITPLGKKIAQKIATL